MAPFVALGNKISTFIRRTYTDCRASAQASQIGLLSGD